MLDLAVFVLRLKQVINWTQRRMQHFTYPVDQQNHGAIFRQLNPIIDGQPLFTIGQGYTTWNQDVYEPRYFAQALAASFAQRDEQLGLVSTRYNLPSLGRVLCFETQLTTHDGIAIAESNAFVDESDVPPLDTWFYLDASPELRRPQLLCWIPQQFEQIMQAAIDIEMMKSYRWLDEAAPRTYQKIVTALAT